MTISDGERFFSGESPSFNKLPGMGPHQDEPDSEGGSSNLVHGGGVSQPRAPGRFKQFRGEGSGVRHPSRPGVPCGAGGVSHSVQWDVGCGVSAVQSPSYEQQSTLAKRLTLAFVRSAKPGRYCDQPGLMLRVFFAGAMHWIWRGTVRGGRVDLGLGGHPHTSFGARLSAARLPDQLPGVVWRHRRRPGSLRGCFGHVVRKGGGGLRPLGPAGASARGDGGVGRLCREREE